MKRLQFLLSIKKKMKSERGTLGWKKANICLGSCLGKHMASSGCLAKYRPRRGSHNRRYFLTDWEAGSLRSTLGWELSSRPFDGSVCSQGTQCVLESLLSRTLMLLEQVPPLWPHLTLILTSKELISKYHSHWGLRLQHMNLGRMGHKHSVCNGVMWQSIGSGLWEPRVVLSQ